MAISSKTRKILWSKSGAKCAICKTDLIVRSGSPEELYIVGDECHISARSAGGPRYNDELSPEDRDSYRNLILLCKNHHKIIDEDISTYTTNALLEIKKEHEVSNSYTNESLDSTKLLNRPIILASSDGDYLGSLEELEVIVWEIRNNATLGGEKPYFLVKFDIDEEIQGNAMSVNVTEDSDLEERKRANRLNELRIHLMELQSSVKNGINAIVFARYLSTYLPSPTESANALASYMRFLKFNKPTELDFSKTRVDVYREKFPSMCVPINLNDHELQHVFHLCNVSDIREFQYLHPHPAFNLTTEIIYKELIPRMVWYANKQGLLPLNTENDKLFDLSDWKIGLG